MMYMHMYMIEEQILKGLSPISLVVDESWGTVTFFSSLILYFINFIINVLLWKKIY